MRQNISSGTIWEQKFGYSRAVRIGNQVFVAGTTAVDEQNELVGGADMYAQACYVWQKIERALNEAGAKLTDVVRIRTFVTDIERWEEAARAEGEVFHDIRPAATLVAITSLVQPDLLIEIEADGGGRFVIFKFEVGNLRTAVAPRISGPSPVLERAWRGLQMAPAPRRPVSKIPDPNCKLQFCLAP
jgi:enamine deaminase RidA (YjgF/YER057c/UK114 family)